MKKILLLILSINLFLTLSAQNRSDSLWAIWSDESQPVVNRLEALQSMHIDDNEMYNPINIDTAYYHAQLQFDLAEENGLKKWMGKALQSKGNYHNNKGEFKDAINYFIQSKAIAEEIGDKETIAGNSFNIGLVHFKQGKFDPCLSALAEAAVLCEEIGKVNWLARCFEMTAMIYNFQKSDLKTALKYLNKALVIREEFIISNDNPRDRFVINGMKQTIRSLNESLEEIKDTIDLNTYNSKNISEETSVESETKSSGLQKSDTLQQSNISESLAYLISSANKMEEEGGNQARLANELLNIGLLYDGKNDLTNALKYYSKSLKISEEIDDKNALGIALGLVGRIYWTQGNMNKALNHLKRGRKIVDEIGNLKEKSVLQNVIASIYLGQDDYEKALELFSQNLEYHKRSGDLVSEVGTLSNIGSTYRQQGYNEKAMEYYDKALVGFEEINMLQGVVGVNLEIGAIHNDEGNYDLAMKNLTRSLTISEKIGYKEGIVLAQTGIAHIYEAKGNQSKAISFGVKGLEESVQSGNISQIMGSAKTLSDSYKSEGNYQKALEMNELYFQMRDSLLSEENQKAVIEMQVQSEYEKQKAIDDLLNEKRVAVEAQKKEDQQKFSIAIGIALLLISLLALGIFNRLKVTRKQKTIIEQQKKKVEQSEKYKEQFLANMSHEIRTPMHAISGMVKILERNEHPASQDIYLNSMKTSSENLVVILNDVLDLSKIEAGKLDIESIPVKPAAVIENVIQILKYKAEDKGLTLTYWIAEDVPSIVLSDPTRLNQILVNLTGNAIKFTDKGSIVILLEKVNDVLRYSIKDRGVGIPKDKLISIFGAFEQGKNSTGRHYGGTGLGLSISKQLVELQKGKIWVESEEGKGSTFYVELPIVAAPVDAISQDLITEDRLKTMAASLKGIRILLAEDNAFNQMIAQDDLAYYIEGVTVDTVENGALVVERFKSGDYDLILMDVQMPEMNGFEATMKIRKLEKASRNEKAIPIVAMTASLLKSEVDNCYDAGMDSYIPKPYKPEELIRPIYEVLN